MSTTLCVILFVGALLVVKGLYEEKLSEARSATRTVYKFIPRSQYEDLYIANSQSGGGLMGSEGVLGSLFYAPADTRSAARPSVV